MDESASAAPPISGGDNPPRHAALPGNVLVDQPFERSGLHTMRAIVVAQAQTLGLPHERVQALELVASELMTNAIEHGGGHGRLSLWASEAEVYCEISDTGPGMVSTPGRSLQDPSAPRGRGLWLANTFADTLSVDHPGRGGTTVTAVIHRPSAIDRCGHI